MVWIGEPSMIHVELPQAHPQTEDFMESWWRRLAVVTPENLAGMRELAAMIARAETPQPTKRNKEGALPSVAIAIGRYSRSFRGMAWQDTVLDLATALEACFGPNDKEQIGLTLRTRAAHLLGRDDSYQADIIYNDVRDLYALRSDIIHGNSELQKSLATLFSERGFNHTFPDDRMHALLDRWRDIVRRAIAARLMLGDNRLGEPLWPLAGDDAAVDRTLVRRDTRDEWLARIVGETATFGLPLLADPAPPLINYLHTPAT
jgi:hypothetical protein